MEACRSWVEGGEDVVVGGVPDFESGREVQLHGAERRLCARVRCAQVDLCVEGAEPSRQPGEISVV